MKKYSIWLDGDKPHECKMLDKDIDVDVLIIGGGMAGLATLYHLKDSNLKTVLVERNICGYGVTARSTAKITYLQEKIYHNIRKYVSYEVASQYLKSQVYAMKLVKRIVDKEKIDCNLQKVKSYIFTEKENSKILEDEREFLKENGIKNTIREDFKLNNRIVQALEVDDTYVFHPLKYINHLKGMFLDKIYEKTSIIKIEKENDYYLCRTREHVIKANKVVVATHYPFFLWEYMLPLKSHIETSYIGCKRTTEFRGISAINIDKPSISFRYHRDKSNYFIYLYNSYMSCNVKNIEENFLEVMKKDNFDYIWSNKDIITNDYRPFIGRIQDNLLIATGFNTWGMTNGNLAGEILSDIIKGKKNNFEELADPRRACNFSKVLRFPVDSFCSVKAYLKSTRRNVNNKKVRKMVINGENALLYVDKLGVTHIVKNKCPHMKCGLVLNEAEETWDCLCHGSRFSLDGKVIEGPANFDISFK